MSNQYSKGWKNDNLTAYEALLEMQEGRCAICEDVLDEPNTDHSHKTGEVRGLLCQRCNCGLGLFRDDPEIVEAAAKYLRYKAEVSATRL